MRHPRFRLALAAVLILSLNFVQLAPCFAGEKSHKVPVAFVGMKFDGLDSDTKERVYERIRETMTGESALHLIDPEEVQRRLGAEQVAAFFAQPDSAAFRRLAEQLQVRFVIAGHIANQSQDPKRTLLVGELKRFDAATNLLHRFEVLKYYENFGVEVLKFEEEYVKTMRPNQEGGKSSWGWVVLAGIAVAGVIALTASFVKAGGEGEGGDGEPVKP
jgi:hypothetical protein